MPIVIHADRMRVADAIAAYLRGEIDNFALDDAVVNYNGEDDGIHEIAWSLWGYYDDFKRHHVSLDATGWKLFRRCIAFLQTDLQVPRRGDNRDTTIWPFQRRSQLFAARPRMARFNLPRFDPTIHAGPIRSQAVMPLTWILWCAVAGSLLFALCTWCSEMLRWPWRY